MILPELARLMMAQEDPSRLFRGLLQAAAWASSAASAAQPELQRQVAAELETLMRLELEINTLRGATQTRWDGRSSAFYQADVMAREDWQQWFGALRRLADLMEDVRAAA